MTDIDIIKNSAQKSFLLSIILFTDNHPHIIKCLRDEDYWKSLDKRSGNNWIILSVKPKQGNYIISGSSSGKMGMMVQKWEEPEDNKPIIKALGIDDTKDLPSIFFFKLDNDNEIMDGLYLKIEGKTEEETYNDLQDIITKVSKAIELGGDFFENAKRIIKKEKVHRIFKKGVGIISFINGLIPGIF